MTPQPKRSETARYSMNPNDIASDYRSVLELAPGGSATEPHDPTRDLAVLSRPLPHPIDRTRSAFDVPGPEAPLPLGSQPGPAFSTPPKVRLIFSKHKKFDSCPLCGLRTVNNYWNVFICGTRMNSDFEIHKMGQVCKALQVRTLAQEAIE